MVGGIFVCSHHGVDGIKEKEVKTEKISREQANRLSMDPKYRFGILSDGAIGVWGDGETEAQAAESAREYFRSEAKNFLDEDGNFDLSALMSDCWVVEVEEDPAKLAASILGRKGGQVRSSAKSAAAVVRNAKRKAEGKPEGGRPKKQH